MQGKKQEEIKAEQKVKDAAKLAGKVDPAANEEDITAAFDAGDDGDVVF